MSGDKSKIPCLECIHLSQNLKFCHSPKTPRLKQGICASYESGSDDTQKETAGQSNLNRGLS